MTETRPDHDAELTICGEPYYFKRGHELLRRIEQRFGALIPLARRIETLSATQAELAAIYEEIVRGGGPDRPGRADLERWVWDEGTPKVSTPLARIIYELPIGNRTLRLLEEEKRTTAAEQRDKEAERGVAGARPTEAPAQVPAKQAAELETVLKGLAEKIAAARTTGPA